MSGRIDVFHLLDAIRRSTRRLADEAATVPSAAPGGALAAVRADLDARIVDLSRGLASIEAECRLARLARELARRFARHSTPREFSAAALEAIGEAMKAARGYVVLFGEAEEEASVLAARHADPAGAPTDAAPSRSVLAELRSKRSTILLHDARDGPLSKETSVVALRLRSVLATPLFVDSRVGGAIVLENSSLAEAFVEEDAILLESVAQILAPYLQVGWRLDQANEEKARLEAVRDKGPANAPLLGRSPAIRAVVAAIDRVKDTDVPVLVEGESGTGKELVARALHERGKRARRPFVALNCAALPEGLVESEIFGHERGAFTGATERAKGRVEQAAGGTLFLDEVGELKYDVQAKLLRVLQERTFQRVGGTETIHADVRLVAATNRDLRRLVAEGRFREDLFYRLWVVPIRVPPLRERREDVPLLVERFLAEMERATGRRASLDPAVVTALEAYGFPGNVRELQNLVCQMVALSETGRIGLDDLPEHVTGKRTLSLDKDPFRRFLRTGVSTNEELKAARTEMLALYERYVRRLEREFLERMLEQGGGSITEAARLAGMNRTLFHRKLRETAED